MKCRNGFVSNSSSSSFIIAIKNGSLKDKFDAMEASLSVDYPLVGMIKQIHKEVLANVQEIDYPNGKLPMYYSSWNDWFEEQPDNVKNLCEDKWKVYIGSASDNGDGAVQYMLCWMDEHKKTDETYVHFEGGY